MKDNSIFIPLDDYIATLDSGYKPKAFYPSMASCRSATTGKIIGKCLRQMYYQWKGIEVTNPRNYRNWVSTELGNAYEKSFLNAYARRGLLKAKAVKIFTEVWGLPITFKLDGVTKDNEIIECKTCYGRAFAYSVEYAPRDSDLVQIMLYLGLTSYPVCILPYGSRDDTAQRAGWRITKQDIEKAGIYLSNILARWKILQHHLDNDILPDRDFQLGVDWMCSYCSYFRPPACYKQAEIDAFFDKGKKKEKKNAEVSKV